MSEPKFEDTMSELSAIVEELERGSVPLDELTTKVRVETNSSASEKPNWKLFVAK